MRKKKTDKNTEDIALIPIDPVEPSGADAGQTEDETDKTDMEHPTDETDRTDTEHPAEKTAESDTEQPAEESAEITEPDSEQSVAEPVQPESEDDQPAEEPERESEALFGAYVAEENKWERKIRIREEKEKAKQAKKRAKYADVDDDTYEHMKAGGVHKFFGVCSVCLLVCGIAVIALFVYRLVIAPSYAQVGEKEANLHVEGFATDTDTSKYEQQAEALTGIATPSDLTDTWVAQEFTPATQTDAQEQNLDGIAVPDEASDETTESTEVQGE